MIVGRRHTDRFPRMVGTDCGEPFLRAGRAPCIVAAHLVAADVDRDAVADDVVRFVDAVAY
jgi:hypothetical protein